MKDLIQNARAVEARLRDLGTPYAFGVSDCISSLCTALEAAQKDAERYRWLKDNRSYHYSMQPDSPAEHGIEYQWQQGTYEERHQGLDGSIDAAIKAQGDANE